MLNEYIKKLKKEKSIYLSIKVIANKAKTEIQEIMENKVIKINISAQPEKGKANKELLKFLSKIFSVSKNNIKIISGETDKKKLIKINLSY